MLKYVEAIRREETTTVDCYSTCKTRKGAFNELGRYIAKHFDKNEGSVLQARNNKEVEEMLSIGNHDYSQWGIECEEVGCATEGDEDGNIQEYSEANFYLMVRFVNA